MISSSPRSGSNPAPAPLFSTLTAAAPTEVFQHIASFLPLDRLVALSQTSRAARYACETPAVWRGALQKAGFTKGRLAKAFAASGQPDQELLWLKQFSARVVKIQRDLQRGPFQIEVNRPSEWLGCAFDEDPTYLNWWTNHGCWRLDLASKSEKGFRFLPPLEADLFDEPRQRIPSQFEPVSYEEGGNWARVFRDVEETQQEPSDASELLDLSRRPPRFFPVDPSWVSILTGLYQTEGLNTFLPAYRINTLGNNAVSRLRPAQFASANDQWSGQLASEYDTTATSESTIVYDDQGMWLVRQADEKTAVRQLLTRSFRSMLLSFAGSLLLVANPQSPRERARFLRLPVLGQPFFDQNGNIKDANEPLLDNVPMYSKSHRSSYGWLRDSHSSRRVTSLTSLLAKDPSTELLWDKNDRFCLYVRPGGNIVESYAFEDAKNPVVHRLHFGLQTSLVQPGIAEIAPDTSWLLAREYLYCESNPYVFIHDLFPREDIDSVDDVTELIKSSPLIQ